MAQEEARLRAQKRKQAIPLNQGIGKWYKIGFLCNEQDKTGRRVKETPLPFIEINVANQIQTHAFIDTGVDGNTISHELFESLHDIDFTETNTQFQDYPGHTAPAFGLCKLPIFVKELICGDEFFVTQPKLQDVPVILGRTWQMRYNCYFNWCKKTVHCELADRHIWVKLAQPDQAYGQQVLPLPPTKQVLLLEPPKVPSNNSQLPDETKEEKPSPK